MTTTAQKMFHIHWQGQNDAGYLRCLGQSWREVDVRALNYYFSFGKLNSDTLSAEQVEVTLPLLKERYPADTFTIIEA